MFLRKAAGKSSPSFWRRNRIIEFLPAGKYLSAWYLYKLVIYFFAGLCTGQNLRSLEGADWKCTLGGRNRVMAENGR